MNPVITELNKTLVQARRVLGQDLACRDKLVAHDSHAAILKFARDSAAIRDEIIASLVSRKQITTSDMSCQANIQTSRMCVEQGSQTDVIGASTVPTITGRGCSAWNRCEKRLRLVKKRSCWTSRRRRYSADSPPTASFASNTHPTSLRKDPSTSDVQVAPMTGPPLVEPSVGHLPNDGRTPQAIATHLSNVYPATGTSPPNKFSFDDMFAPVDDSLRLHNMQSDVNPALMTGSLAPLDATASGEDSYRTLASSDENSRSMSQVEQAMRNVEKEIQELVRVHSSESVTVEQLMRSQLTAIGFADAHSAISTPGSQQRMQVSAPVTALPSPSSVSACGNLMSSVGGCDPLSPETVLVVPMHYSSVECGDLMSSGAHSDRPQSSVCASNPTSVYGDLTSRLRSDKLALYGSPATTSVHGDLTSTSRSDKMRVRAGSYPPSMHGDLTSTSRSEKLLARAGSYPPSMHGDLMSSSRSDKVPESECLLSISQVPSLSSDLPATPKSDPQLPGRLKVNESASCTAPAYAAPASSLPCNPSAATRKTSPIVASSQPMPERLPQRQPHRLRPSQSTPAFLPLRNLLHTTAQARPSAIGEATTSGADGDAQPLCGALMGNVSVFTPASTCAAGVQPNSSYTTPLPRASSHKTLSLGVDPHSNSNTAQFQSVPANSKMSIPSNPNQSHLNTPAPSSFLHARNGMEACIPVERTSQLAQPLRPTGKLRTSFGCGVSQSQATSSLSSGVQPIRTHASHAPPQAASFGARGGAFSTTSTFRSFTPPPQLTSLVHNASTGGVTAHVHGVSRPSTPTCENNGRVLATDHDNMADMPTVRLEPRNVDTPKAMYDNSHAFVAASVTSSNSTTMVADACETGAWGMRWMSPSESPVRMHNSNPNTKSASSLHEARTLARGSHTQSTGMIRSNSHSERPLHFSLRSPPIAGLK